MKIGIMSFAHMHAASYANGIKRLPNAELVAIYDDVEERGKKMAEQYGAKYYGDQEEFLAQDIDAVIVCSENVHHKDMVINAAKAKKHILCEKPLATNVEDAKEMIQVCKDEGVKLQVAYPVRFTTPMQEVKKMVDDGEFGEILAFRTTNRGRNPGGWFIDEELSGGGAVLDHTVHMVDIMRWLTGEEITEVSAIVDSYFQDLDLDDAGILTYKFESGIIGSHDASWSRFPQFPTWGDATIEIIGTKKTIKADAFGEDFNVFSPSNSPLEYVVYGSDSDFELIRDFVDCVVKDREPSVTGYDGLKSLEVALAAYEANEKNEVVKL